MKTLFNIFIVVLTTISFSSSAQIPILNSFPSSTSVIYLDFDGQYVMGTSWNWNGPITCAPASLTVSQIQEVFNRVSEDYRPFNVNVTTDSTIYWAAPANQRTRVILTATYQWYGATAGGVSYIGSFKWGDNTPCFVFTSLLQYNSKYISEAAAHEAGHTLGLKHQSLYDANCNKITEYNPGAGSGEISWAPIMGYGYYNNLTLWHNGSDPYGCKDFQDDLSIISGSLTNGYRTDDLPDTGDTAPLMDLSSNQFTVNGVIEKETDKDVVKFTITSFTNFHVDAIPYNLGAGNAGSDLDIKLDLLDSNQNIIASSNPATLLSASVDTVLNPGNYYLRIQPTGNINAPNYASLGSYSMNAIITPGILPVHQFLLNGSNENGIHKLNWTIVADEQIAQFEMQVSDNGRDFNELAQLNAQDKQYQYSPKTSGVLYYRIKVVMDNGHAYYSNIASLQSATIKKPALVFTLIHSTIVVNSYGTYNYSLTDMNGRILKKGIVQSGETSIDASPFPNGIYVIRYDNSAGSYSEKMVKQ